MYITGITPNLVDAEAKFALGSLGADYNGCVYMYLEADSAIAAGYTVIIHADAGADEVGTTNAATGTGVGKQCAVAPEVAISAGEFFWGCVFAPAVAGKRARLAADCLAHTRLIPLGDTTNSGILDDDADGPAYIHGVTATAAGDASTGSLEIVQITWPHVAWDDIEAS